MFFIRKSKLKKVIEHLEDDYCGYNKKPQSNNSLMKTEEEWFNRGNEFAVHYIREKFNIKTDKTGIWYDFD